MHEVPVDLAKATIMVPSIDDGSAGWTTPGRIPEDAVEAAVQRSWHLEITTSDVREILEAAAPYIRAQALEEAASAWDARSGEFEDTTVGYLLHCAEAQRTTP